MNAIYLLKASLLEISELVKDIEEKFGVEAAAPVAVAAALAVQDKKLLPQRKLSLM